MNELLNLQTVSVQVHDQVAPALSISSCDSDSCNVNAIEKYR